jgi:hypothetical protein
VPVVAGDGSRPGRPEGTLDPAAGPAATLAAQLRELRKDAGRPSYRELARRAYYSHSALSQAAAGRELPSLAVTLAFVEACGGDRHEWTMRWEKAAAAVRSSATPDAEAVSGAARPDNRARRYRIGRASWRRLTVAGLAAAVAAAVLVALMLPTHGLAADVSDGAYPSVGHCDTAAEQLGSSPVRSGSGVLWGTVQLRYSLLCRSVWARFVPSSALSPMGIVRVTLALIRRSDGKMLVYHFWFTGHHDQRSDMLLLHGSCARASVTIAAPGRAPMGATTACQPPP